MTAVLERLPRLAVTLECLHCGDSSDELVDQLADLGPLPRRCSRCSGPSVASAAQVRHVFNPAFRVDMTDPDRPRRGRPPGAKNKPKAAA